MALGRESLEFSRAVDHADDFDVPPDNSIQNEIRPLDETTSARRDVGPAPAKLGMSGESKAALFQPVEHSICRRRIVARDRNPNVDKIRLGLAGLADAGQAVRPWRACVSAGSGPCA
jgi:hypothetical protein